MYHKQKRTGRRGEVKLEAVSKELLEGPENTDDASLHGGQAGALERALGGQRAGVGIA